MKTHLRNIISLTILIFSPVLSQLQDRLDVQLSNSTTPHAENSIADEL
jgi:hypothetical protein